MLDKIKELFDQGKLKCLSIIDKFKPVDDSMIAPVDYDVLGPNEAFSIGSLIYIAHAPVNLDLNRGIRVSVPFKQTGTATLLLYADGQVITNSPFVITSDTAVIPRSDIKSLWRIIPEGARLEAMISAMSDYAPYPAPQWKGLRVAYLAIGVSDL